jgi:hypothetical protein
MRLLALLVALSLTACAGVGDIEQRIVWHRAATGDLLAICGEPDDRGCSWRESGVCHVAAPDLGGDTLTTLGHEVKHCFDGKWHL